MSFIWQPAHLLLNPRLPLDARAALEDAWRTLVLPRFGSDRAPIVGIATSGSSGDPRGRLIVLSKHALLANAASVNEWFESTGTDVWMKTLPSFHVGGLGILLRASLSGARVVESTLERWEPVAFHSELERSCATILSLVATQLFDLVTLGLRAPNRLRAVVIGGGRLEASLRDRAGALGWPVFASYGMTECCSQAATARKPGDPRMMPLSHARFRIAADGRIELKSEALLTAQIVFSKDGARIDEHPAGEWYCSEDLGRLEDDGSLTVLGRSGDFVKIGGEGVVLARLEERLENLKARLGFKADAALLAASDDRLGAAIVLVTTAKAAALPLIEAYNQSVLPFERIRSTYELEKIPRSELGKLLRSSALELAGLKPVVTGA